MKEYWTKIIEQHEDVGLIRLLLYLTITLLMALVSVIFILFNVYKGFVIMFEWDFFMFFILFFAFSFTIAFSFLVYALCELKDVRKKETLKYTNYLHARLRRIVPSNGLTGKESYQALTAKRLNILLYRSFIIADKKGNFGIFIRMSNSMDLQRNIDNNSLRQIASYFAKLSNTRFIDIQNVSLEQRCLIHFITKDYAVIRLIG